MKTLKLNKKSKGYYSNRIGNIEIVVSNSLISCGLGSNEWEGVISDWSKSDDEFIVFRAFAETKRDIYNIIVNELLSK